MPEVKKVILKVERRCSKCHDVMVIGTIVVKDRRVRDKDNKPSYYHAECKDSKKGK